jgi:hypothetical protein
MHVDNLKEHMKEYSLSVEGTKKDCLRQMIKFMDDNNYNVPRIPNDRQNTIRNPYRLHNGQEQEAVIVAGNEIVGVPGAETVNPEIAATGTKTVLMDLMVEWFMAPKQLRK